MKLDCFLKGIIRNRLKVKAVILNVKSIIELQCEYGFFKNWFDFHHPQTKDEWVKLFKKRFKFTGGEIVNEFLLSTWYLEGAHAQSCPICDKIIALSPAWNKQNK